MSNKKLFLVVFLTDLGFFFLGYRVAEFRMKDWWAQTANMLNKMECACLHPERGLSEKPKEEGK